ncbi:MAG: hypothetical protein MUF34_36180 [Polyangiaceae bacterium]|nr:hypothetical protein [Polyangiaceae bacterium]
MSRPSWVEAPATDSDEAHSASGVRLANELASPPSEPTPSLDAPPSSPAPPHMLLESGVMRAASPTEPERSSSSFRASDAYDRHLDEVVRAFFPGWGARSSRTSSPSAPPKGGRSV